MTPIKTAKETDANTTGEKNKNRQRPSTEALLRKRGNTIEQDGTQERVKGEKTKVNKHQFDKKTGHINNSTPITQDQDILTLFHARQPRKH